MVEGGNFGMFLIKSFYQKHGKIRHFKNGL